jgi:uncharacterized protein DUF5672
MLELPDVTLVSIFNVCHELTSMAIDECLKCVRFGGLLLFSDNPFGRTDVTQIKKFANYDEAERFTNIELLNYVKTSHLLYIQWDSWVTNPDQWRKEFLEYDYIGAPWWYKDNYNVGNSGFSLRSKALLDYLASHRDEFPPALPEDHVLCRDYQPRLTPRFKWAPDTLAWHFSFERTMLYQPNQTFGYHGVFNWPYVLQGDALKKRVKLARDNPYIYGSVGFRDLEKWRLDV